MVVVGVDAHKQTHTLVVVDRNGQELGSVTIRATSAGHLKAVKWVAEFGDQRMWALEDCHNMTRRFESELLAAGETVIRVPTKMMAGARQGARELGKSDPIDAIATGTFVSAGHTPPILCTAPDHKSDVWSRTR